MRIALHQRARTTPAVRAEIAASSESVSALARRFGVTPPTIDQWRSRDSVHDRSHTAHRLQTTLTPAQEAMVVQLRKTLLPPLDDLLAVTREFLCQEVSRSGLDRCLRRHGVGNLNALKPAIPQTPHKAFKRYAPGDCHVDIQSLPPMADERTPLPEGAAGGQPDQDHPVADRQRQGVHRPLVGLARASAQWQSRVRPAVPGAWHRASPD